LPENRFHWSAEHQLGSDLICVHLCPSVVKIGFEMALFGFKWVRFLTPKPSFHIGEIRRFLHF